MSDMSRDCGRAGCQYSIDKARVETVEHTIAPCCIAWFSIIVVGCFSRILNFLCVVLSQVPGSGDISAVCGRGG